MAAIANPLAEDEVYDSDDVLALFAPTSPPARTQSDDSSTLSLPVCIPQINAVYDSPFVLAYAPALAEVGIGEEDFLRCIEGLNVALIASPPLQVVSAAGMVVGFVPWHWAQLVSVVMTSKSKTSFLKVISIPCLRALTPTRPFAASAEVAIRVISKTLTDRYLKHVNKTFFGPAGLVLRICTTSAMNAILTDSPAPSKPSKLKTFGSKAGDAAKGIALRLPVVQDYANMLMKKPNAIPYDPNEMPYHRQIRQYDGMIAPLNFNVRPAKTPSGVMDTMSNTSIKIRRWNQRRTEKDADTKRKNLAEGNYRTLPGPAVIQDTFNNVLRATGRGSGGRAGGIGDRRAAFKLRTQVEIADRKEMDSREKVLWLCLLTKEQDARIEDRETADGDEEALIITEDEWREELSAEGVSLTELPVASSST